MQKKLFLTMICLMAIFFSWSQSVLDGAYELQSAQYGDGPAQTKNNSKQTIYKIFKDGYWIAAFFGDPAKPFSGSGGGTYKIENGKYVENIGYYSWDSTAVGQTISFDYKTEGDKYFQKGYINSNKYKNYLIDESFEKAKAKETLMNNSLEGAWEMETGVWGKTKLGEGVYKGVKVIKLYAFPRFAFSYYDPETNRFEGAGGGTYQFDGKTLTEKIEYWSWGKPSYPLSVMKVEVSDRHYTQKGWDDKLFEKWKKL